MLGVHQKRLLVVHDRDVFPDHVHVVLRLIQFDFLFRASFIGFADFF